MQLKTLWDRPESRFLILFLAFLSTSFFVIALQPVNDAFVVPYTAVVAKMAGAVLQVLEPGLTIDGVILRSPRFAVTIYNGCNGLITSLIFISGVLAFPARWPAKLLGVLGGLLAIQLINLVRIVSLFFIGVFMPSVFNESHIFIWQSLVILFGVGLWVLWAQRFGARTRTADASA